ncbi:MAG: methyltransferase domain-containing protein [Holophagaceae bacterium]
MRRDAAPYQSAMELAPRARGAEFRLPLALAAPRAGEILVDCPSGGAYLRPELAEFAPGCRYVPFESKPQYAAFVPDLVLGDWLRLPFRAASVDVLLSIAALHHLLGGRGPFYREGARVLAPGGRLVVADVAADTGPARWLDDFVGRRSSEGHQADFLEADRERRALEAAGLRVRHAELAHYTWDFADRPAACGFMKGLFRLDQPGLCEIEEAIGDLLGWADGPGAHVRWTLLHLRADRPEEER